MSPHTNRTSIIPEDLKYIISLVSQVNEKLEEIGVGDDVKNLVKEVARRAAMVLEDSVSQGEKYEEGLKCVQEMETEILEIEDFIDGFLKAIE